MSTFSQRYGFSPARLDLQIESMDRPLRVALWSWFHGDILTRAYMESWSLGGEVIAGTWTDVLLLPLDELPRYLVPTSEVYKQAFLDGPWYIVVDILEAALQELDDEDESEAVNELLESHRAGYRFVGGEMVRITSELEIEAVNLAVEARIDGLDPARKHLSRAIELFSERPTPDYRNTIKEAISAAESAACTVMGVRNFDAAVKKMVTERTLHPAMQRAMSALFGYSSDEQGVRHGFTSAEDRVDYAEALFVLVTCSAFLSYIAEHLRQREADSA